MSIMPDTDPKKTGMQNKCCIDNLDFYYYGDGVEWEMWECKKCKLKYVVPIDIQRFYEDASVILNQEDYNE